MSKRRPPTQADSLGFWVFRLNRAMFAELTRQLAPHGVSGAEWTVLRHLSRGSATPVLLADLMQIDRAAVSRFLAQLEEKQLIVRTPHPTDRRSALLALSSRGERLLPKLMEAASRINRRFLSHLKPGEREQLTSLLRKLGESAAPEVFSVRDCRPQI